MSEPLTKEELVTCRDCGVGVAIISRGVTVLKYGYALCPECGRENNSAIYEYSIRHESDLSEMVFKCLHFDRCEPQPLPEVDPDLPKEIWEMLRDE